MLLRRLAFFLAAAGLLGACGRAAPALPGFDAAAWRRDPYGCQGVRQQQIKPLLQGKEQLYGVRTSDVEQLLGRPDEEELAEQTEKIYCYYLAPGPQCEPAHPRSGINKLRVRFGSLGTVIEVLPEQPVPH